MYPALKRLLFALDPEIAHDISLWALGLLDIIPEVAQWQAKGARNVQHPMTVSSVSFPGPVGLAAGLDKNAKAVLGFSSLGFHFLEVGTVTPRPQPGNEKPRLFRLLDDEAIINRFGFNNEGQAAMAGRLRELPFRDIPVGVNLGKNRHTPLEAAEEDYVSGARLLGPLADYLVINLSSPNTPGLRALQNPKSVLNLSQRVKAAAPGTPVFLKISPDLSEGDLGELVDVILEAKLDALICTNTTIERNVVSAFRSESGGLSGRPLFQKSTHVLGQVFSRSQGRLPLIGVGGIFSGEDAWKKICAGASLIQLYSGFIYRGPALIREINDTLAQKLAQHQMTSLAQAVGRDIQ
jgi:dihydroorotate dehydrogenase